MLRPATACILVMFFNQQIVHSESEDKIPVNLGVVVIYDQAFLEHIIHTQKFQRQEKKAPTDYFAALLKAAELRFYDVEDLRITLTLKNAYQRDIAVATDATYHNSVNGSATMEALKSELETYDTLYSDADIVIFVSGKEVIPEVTKDKQWLGVAQRGQVCKDKDKVGLVSDDGKTFKAADDVAMQVALLLNASRDEVDNECKITDYFLLSSIYGGFKSKFSNCSKREMTSFVTHTEDQCWEDEVQDRFHAKLPAEYNKITGYDICSAYHNYNREVETCQPQDEDPKRNTTCGVQCCDYQYQDIPYKAFRYVQKAADGTKCGEGKICINKQCEEVEIKTVS